MLGRLSSTHNQVKERLDDTSLSQHSSPHSKNLALVTFRATVSKTMQIKPSYR